MVNIHYCLKYEYEFFPLCLPTNRVSVCECQWWWVAQGLWAVLFVSRIDIIGRIHGMIVE